MTDHPLRPFLAASRRYLREEYPAKMRIALDQLDPADLWWRPNPASYSAGNLVLHLAGNLRQWVVHGLGGVDDVRRRSEEFSRMDGMSLAEVWSELERSIGDADRVLAGLDPEELTRPRTIQGLETTGLEALYHVVEHFSMHTGQILYLVKQRKGSDLGFYEVDDQGSVTGTRW